MNTTKKMMHEMKAFARKNQAKLLGASTGAGILMALSTVAAHATTVTLDPTQAAGINDGIDSLAGIVVNEVIAVLPHLWLPIGFLLALTIGLGLFFRYVRH